MTAERVAAWAPRGCVTEGDPHSSRANTGKKPASAARSKGGPQSPRLSYILLHLMDSVDPACKLILATYGERLRNEAGWGKPRGIEVIKIH